MVQSIDPNNNSGIQRLAWTYPPNNNIWLLLQFGYPWVGSLIPCIHLYTRPTLVWTLWSWTVSFILRWTNIKSLQQEFGSAILMSSIIYWHATSRCFYEFQKEKGCVVMNWSHAVWQLKRFQFVQGVSAAGRGWCILWCTLWEEAALGGEVSIWLFQGPTICWLHFKLVWSLLLGAMALHCSLDTWVYLYDVHWAWRRPKYSRRAYLMIYFIHLAIVLWCHPTNFLFVRSHWHLQLNIHYSSINLEQLCFNCLSPFKTLLKCLITCHTIVNSG